MIVRYYGYDFRDKLHGSAQANKVGSESGLDARTSSEGTASGFVSYATEKLLNADYVAKFDPMRGAFNAYISHKLNQLFIDFLRNKGERQSTQWRELLPVPTSRKYRTVGNRVEKLHVRDRMDVKVTWEVLSSNSVVLMTADGAVSSVKGEELVLIHGFSKQTITYPTRSEKQKKRLGEQQSKSVFSKAFQFDDGSSDDVTWGESKFRKFCSLIKDEYGLYRQLSFTSTETPYEEDSELAKNESCQFQREAGLHEYMNEQDAMEQHEDILHMIGTAVKELEYSEQDILAYQMRYLYDYKVSEIAQMLKLEQSVLYNRMNQINKVLRQSYSGYLGTLSRTSRREP